MPAPTTPTEAIVGRLLATAGVTAKVARRVYPVLPTQDPGDPYVVVTRTAGGNDQRLAANMRLNRYSMRVDCYSATQATAEAVLAAVNAALGGWADRAGAGVQGCFNDDDADEQVADDGGGSAWHVSGQTFTLFFEG